MVPAHACIAATATLVALTACQRPASPPPPVAAPAPAVTPVATPPAPSNTPAEVLDGMDQRTPVPLLPMMANHQKQNMRDHLLAVQEIVAALAADDFPAIEKSARRIGFSEQMGAMCTHMGAAAPGFTPAALTFHHTADTIAEAAAARDRARVVTALAATLGTCTTCHATYKQRIVDEPTFTRLSGSAAPMAGHGAP